MTRNRSEVYLYRHEKEAIEKRKKIAAALACGWTYEQIQREIGVSTSTISSVKKLMEDQDPVCEKPESEGNHDR